MKDTARQGQLTAGRRRLLGRLLEGFAAILLLTSCKSSAPPETVAQQCKPPEPLVPEGTVTPCEVQYDSAKERPYHIDSGSRFLSGPFGDRASIEAVVQHVRGEGKSVRVSNRTIDLPNKMVNDILEIHRYRYPEACGGYKFTVYTGTNSNILQYDFVSPAKTIRIRDYLSGGSAFTAPSLWGPYDHVVDADLKMCILPGDGQADQLGFLKGNYEIGWVPTTIAQSDQDNWGRAYANAVSIAARCDATLAAAAKTTQSPSPTQATDGEYTVAAGDTLRRLAERFYGDAALWGVLYDANREHLAQGPDVLNAGQRLKIPPRSR